MPVQTIFQSKSTLWIDVTQPTIELLKEIGAQYQIDEYLLEDSIDPDHLPKYEQSGNIKFFLTRENVNQERSSLRGISDVSTKLSFFLINSIIISIHRLESPSVMSVKKDLDALSPEEKEEYTADDIALMLALEIIKTFDAVSTTLDSKLDQLEREVFMDSEPKKDLIKNLYKLKRKSGLNTRILNLSSGWINQFHLLNLKPVELEDLFDKQRDVVSDFDHLTIQVNNLISMYLAMSDQRANQVMKLLAMYSVYFLPITFIAGLYGMNFKYMPELETPYGYFLTLGAMALIVVFTFIYFQRKKWGG